jgi:signal transduction histidine kinase/putative methionine-R-sulfoxide reductase with GAF domain
MRRGAKPAKAKVEAKPPIARRARKSERSRVRDLEKRLAEAVAREAEALKRESEVLEQQAATVEILRSISASPTDHQPVFDTIVRNAGSVCGAVDAILWTADGDDLVIRAHHGPIPGDLGARQPIQGSVAGRALSEARVVHVENLPESDDFPHGREVARRGGWHTTLSVPLLRQGVAVGAILIRRSEVRPFTPTEITLLQTFADQAVIAIENVRLFKELQEKNHSLTEAHARVSEALEQQTATSEILNVISRSPTDVQPVLDTVVEHASRLCSARDAQIFRREDAVLRLVAHHGPIPTGGVGDFTMPISRGTVNGRAVMEQRPIMVADLRGESMEFPEGSAISHNLGHRAVLSVPLMREGVAIGTLTVRRAEVVAFTDAQMALLQTFADQAVIAIENVRLFTALEARNRDLTATSEILQVISRSPTDIQPVLDTVAESAARLCEAFDASVFRLDGDRLRLVAHHGHIHPGGEPGEFTLPLVRGSFNGRSVLDRQTVHIADGQAAANGFPEGSEFARSLGFHTVLNVPLMREGIAIGTISLRRMEVRLFTERQVALLRTFADQAVIAIENVRLFTELQARTQDLTRSVGELTALGEVSRTLSSTLDLETVLQTIVTRAVQLSGADAGTILEYDEPAEVFHPRVSTEYEEVVAALRSTGLRKGEGAVGRMAVTREPVQIADIGVEGAYESRVREAMLQSGRRAVLALPLLREEHIIGGLVISRNGAGEFPVEIIELLKTFATQSTLAIQNARLFREIEAKSGQLEIASRHKSEFLANMSHELRTPLNAIIGYSELLEEEAGGVDGGRLVPDLHKIATAAKHQLSLINDILDLSKVEAGRMELELTALDLPSTIDSTLTLVRERATRRGITLARTIDERLGSIAADERKVKQVLLNLLSNALKFTPEGGRIDVGATVNGELVEVTVADTGVGIAPADQEAVFEEFRQVGAAHKKVEGTGLGLALCRKFVELHGGRIWVESEPGRGSTFTFTLPVHREE